MVDFIVGYYFVTDLEKNDWVFEVKMWFWSSLEHDDMVWLESLVHLHYGLGYNFDNWIAGRGGKGVHAIDIFRSFF